MPQEDPVVLVVDDDASIRSSLQSLLRSVGYDVRLFDSAKDFLDGDPPSGPACVVLDVRLPGKSGLEVQRELAAAGHAYPLVIISGHADVQMSVSAMKNGAVDFLAKPFRDQDLLDAVQRGIEIDRSRLDQASDSAELEALFEGLSPREKQVMAYVVQGLMNKQIAHELRLSEVTVKSHRARMMTKMKAKSLPELVRMADRISK